MAETGYNFYYFLRYFFCVWSRDAQHKKKIVFVTKIIITTETIQPAKYRAARVFGSSLLADSPMIRLLPTNTTTSTTSNLQRTLFSTLGLV